MDPLAIAVYALTISLFIAVAAVGLRCEPRDLGHLFQRPGRLAQSLLVMFVLAPAITTVVCKLFSLHPAMITALVTLSISPVGALFSQAMLPLVAPGRLAFARGMLFASIVLSVILTPVAVEAIQAIFGGDRHVPPMAVAQVAASSMLLPLGLGLAVGRWRPGARRWIPLLQKTSSLVYLACLAIILVAAWPLMASVVVRGTLSAILVITLLGLAAGHWLGGPEEDERTVVAFAAVSRHPGVAIAVASFTDQPLTPVAVLIAGLVGELITVPYKHWRKRLRLGGAGMPGHVRLRGTEGN